MTVLTRDGYVAPALATDIIIEYTRAGKEGIVLIERKNPPIGLALPGGFAEVGISLGENAAKEAREETNLEIKLITPEAHPLCVNSRPDRDPRGHVMSVTYVAKGYGTLRAGDDAATARFYTMSELEQVLADERLVFDHADIVQTYLEFRAAYGGNNNG